MVRQKHECETEVLSPVLARALEIIKERELEKVKKRGMEEGKISVAEELIKRNFLKEEIVELTGLKLQKVVKLRESV